MAQDEIPLHLSFFLPTMILLSSLFISLTYLLCLFRRLIVRKKKREKEKKLALEGIGIRGGGGGERRTLVSLKSLLDAGLRERDEVLKGRIALQVSCSHQSTKEKGDPSPSSQQNKCRSLEMPSWVEELRDMVAVTRLSAFLHSFVMKGSCLVILLKNKQQKKQITKHKKKKQKKQSKAKQSKALIVQDPFL